MDGARKLQEIIKPQGITGWARDNFYLYGLVEPMSGESCLGRIPLRLSAARGRLRFFWEFSHLDSLCFQHFLDLFSQTYPNSLNLIQMDNGSFHKSQDLKWADNIIPIFQPPYSPELNPIERLWEHIKSRLAWEYCDSLTQLRTKLKQVLNSLSEDTIASICGWDYITSALLSATS